MAEQRVPQAVGAGVSRRRWRTWLILAFGIVASLLVAAAEREPMFVFFLIIAFTAFEVAAFGAIVVAAHWVLNEVAGWTIFVANLLAAGAMLGYFFRRHRTLAHRMTEAWEEHHS